MSADPTGDQRRLAAFRQKAGKLWLTGELKLSILSAYILVSKIQPPISV